MTEGVAPTSAPQNAPDWSTVDRDILCPLCEYNLRGLIEPRCPECGHRFQWGEVLTQGDRVHPFLFEHQAHRPVWAFFKTFGLSQVPPVFWKSVSPIHAPSPWRLILYWGILLSLGMACGLVAAIVRLPVAQAGLAANRQFLTAQLTSPGVHPYYTNLLARHNGSVPAVVDEFYPRPTLRGAFWWMITGDWRIRRSLMPVVAAVLIWPWMTLATLMIFRISMNRARIKTGHVLRCVIYAHDIALAAVPLLLLVFFTAPEIWTLPVAVLAFCVILRLWLGYFLYLRFPHSFATVLASQVIVGMTLMKMWLTMRGF